MPSRFAAAPVTFSGKAYVTNNGAEAFLRIDNQDGEGLVLGEYGNPVDAEVAADALNVWAGKTEDSEATTSTSTETTTATTSTEATTEAAS